MRKCLIGILILICLPGMAQRVKNAAGPERPKLVVGIVVDQMRWDYLYRYYDRYGSDGFKRLLREGFSVANFNINYLPTATAVGHASIFTGSVPAINGITGNSWIDQLTGKTVYCTEDNAAAAVGGSVEAGKMSPRNLLSSTITDELRLATNREAKVVGISLKDRAAILPVGHMANAAYWFDDATASFMTSDYYMSALPDWVQAFNRENRPSKLMEQPWSTLYPLETYNKSAADAQAYEGILASETAPVFPHNLAAAYAKSKGAFRQTPGGNTLTLDFARAAIQNYNLGQGSVTDFLTVNCASTDYVGHLFGPNSIEIEDTFLRLDQDLGKFLKYLDKEVGKGEYLVFLTADHGVAHSKGFMEANKLPSTLWNGSAMKETLNKRLETEFGARDLVKSVSSYQVHFNWPVVQEKKLNPDQLKVSILATLRQHPDVLFAVDAQEAATASLPAVLRDQVVNTYHAKRSGSIQFFLNAGSYEGGRTGASHGGWSPYDTHLPLIFMGWGIRPGETSLPAYMSDVAPTLAALLHLQVPNGSIGKPIPGVGR